MNNYRVSAIDIGSSSIRMTIYEISNDNFTIIEELRQSVKLGKDCFYIGKISRNTINACVEILNNYKKKSNEYKVSSYRTVATTAVREAANVDIFLDNIRTLTNTEIEILSPFKETEYINFALTDILKESKIDYLNENRCVVEIGAGNVEITLTEGKCIVFSRSLPLGILKLKQIFRKQFKNNEDFNNFLSVMIEHELQNLKRDIPKLNINKIFGIGHEIIEISKQYIDDNKKIVKTTKKFLDNLCNKSKNYTEEEIVHKLKVPYNFADNFYSASLILKKIVDFFGCKDIYIPNVSLRDGIIRNFLAKDDENDFFKSLELQLKITSQIIGKSLNYDENHAQKVTELALKLFDQTKEIHHLGRIERCYLIVASMLHDIGSTLSYRAHHKHSQYIISAQNFFSLNNIQKKIIANVARYHRKSTPKRYHKYFMTLTHKNKIIVMKLASLLRIADSLDNTHLQIIDDIKITKKENTIIINAYVVDQFYSEIYSFNHKKKMFQDFFGVNIKIVITRKHEN